MPNYVSMPGPDGHEFARIYGGLNGTRYQMQMVIGGADAFADYEMDLDGAHYHHASNGIVVYQREQHGNLWETRCLQLRDAQIPVDTEWSSKYGIEGMVEQSPPFGGRRWTTKQNYPYDAPNALAALQVLGHVKGAPFGVNGVAHAIFQFIGCQYSPADGSWVPLREDANIGQFTSYDDQVTETVNWNVMGTGDVHQMTRRATAATPTKDLSLNLWGQRWDGAKSVFVPAQIKQHVHADGTSEVQISVGGRLGLRITSDGELYSGAGRRLDVATP